MTMVPRLARRRRLLERHWPWFLLALFASFAVAVVVLAVGSGLLSEFEGFEAIVRGYTIPGLLFGSAALGLSAVAFAYAFRKRALQERLPIGRATLATWLWAHVYLGLLALVLALAHAGYGSFSAQLSSGKLLLFVLFALVGGGVLWRLLYVVVPPAAARAVGNYSRAGSRTRAEACLVEIEKIAAGSSVRFRELTGWVMSRTPAPHELSAAVASLAHEERAAFAELARLAVQRHEALTREQKQARYLRLLQGLRIAHVPFALLFLVLVPLHVVLAYDVPARLLEPGVFGGHALGGYEPASSCRSCHREIYDAWKHSMHAHAMTSPIMIAQTNQVAARVLDRASSPDPKKVCVSCHGPIGTLLTNGNTLPLPAEPLSERALLDDGISCAVCHQWQGTPATGGAGLARFLDGLRPGRTYYGPYSDPVGNAFHRSAPSELFTTKREQLCRNCHSVQLDLNGDGRFERGVDLVLQTLFDEWQFYAAAGGASCVDCHMPLVPRATRAADSASIPFEQDEDAPPRNVRDHAFIGVDYALDSVEARERSRSKREGLLRSAGLLAVPKDSLTRRPAELAFIVTLANTGTGHNLPGGFAFVRQMWLEVVLEGAGGERLAESGRLAQPSDDLCDASIVSDPASPMRPFVLGCGAADAQLVNFQQMLVDKVEVLRDAAGAVQRGPRGENLLSAAAGAREIVYQELTSGPVPRVRPATSKPTPPLAPGETASFPYVFAFDAGKAPKRLTARLLFRVAPPYFLRALEKNQAQSEAVRLGTLVSALEVTEMAKVVVELAE